MEKVNEIQRLIDELIEQIDNLMLRMRNGYLEPERSDS